MLSTGIKTPIGLKITGPDLDVLNRLAEPGGAIFKEMPNTTSVCGERVTGGLLSRF